MLELSRYTADRASEWDAFVDQARNGHFFFKRGYLDYHADRFSDHSLIIARAGRTEALLPANRTADAVYSHQGLTYGGLLVGEQGGARISEALGLIAASLAAEGVSSLFYKSMPHIYHRQPAEEDLYVLHRLGARLVRRELSSAICLQAPRRYSKGKTGNLRRASTAEITFGRDYDATSFMTLLQETLRSRHDATPTHSLEELARLMRAFPENIRLYSARRQGRYLAGAVVFINHAVVHTQYLANSDEGREVGALDFIIDTLISREFSGSRWFSFGISTTDGGRELNEGLLHHKEAFGARGIVHDMYVLDVKEVARRTALRRCSRTEQPMFRAGQHAGPTPRTMGLFAQPRGSPMNAKLADFARRLWRGAVRMAEAKNGVRFRNLNKFMAALTVLAIVALPAFVVLLWGDGAASTSGAIGMTVYLGLVWLALFGCAMMYGREDDPPATKGACTS